MQAVAKAYLGEDYNLSGSPMSIETYKERIQDAKSRIDAGHFTSHEDLEKEVEK